MQPAHPPCRAKCLHAVSEEPSRWLRRSWICALLRVHLIFSEPFCSKTGQSYFYLPLRQASQKYWKRNEPRLYANTGRQNQSDARQTAPPPPVSWQQRPLYSGDEYETLSLLHLVSRHFSPRSESFSIFAWNLFPLLASHSDPSVSLLPLFGSQTHSSYTHPKVLNLPLPVHCLLIFEEKRCHGGIRIVGI